MSIQLETAEIQIDTIGVQAAQDALSALTKGTADLSTISAQTPEPPPEQRPHVTKTPEPPPGPLANSAPATPSSPHDPPLSPPPLRAAPAELPQQPAVPPQQQPLPAQLPNAPPLAPPPDAQQPVTRAPSPRPQQKHPPRPTPSPRRGPRRPPPATTRVDTTEIDAAGQLLAALTKSTPPLTAPAPLQPSPTSPLVHHDQAPPQGNQEQPAQPPDLTAILAAQAATNVLLERIAAALERPQPPHNIPTY